MANNQQNTELNKLKKLEQFWLNELNSAQRRQNKHDIEICNENLLIIKNDIRKHTPVSQNLAYMQLSRLGRVYYLGKVAGKKIDKHYAFRTDTEELVFEDGIIIPAKELQGWDIANNPAAFLTIYTLYKWGAKASGTFKEIPAADKVQGELQIGGTMAGTQRRTRINFRRPVYPRPAQSADRKAGRPDSRTQGAEQRTFFKP